MTTTYLRQARTADLPVIMKIINEAKAYLKQQNVDQWQHGYPEQSDMTADVAAGLNYVLIRDDVIVGTATLQRGIDDNYKVIEQGTWRGAAEATYTSIHRIAVAAGYRGQHLSETLITNLLTLSLQLGYADVRIDTHPENVGMQHVIKQNGFEYRGIIYMHEPKEPRYAYQLQLK
ncbi:GNAT family N-acetyltransferase [Loigolactobacillus zhaoyuanensis]|uniref:N-acetyltransferase family protein n=1 Tax=Loigolactobacillus zhaoyuanensis TaxID=2486017 RepID=A0ABW8UB98_9LACO|nr:GNAT family N-acetyltransferase [Loigolactobacillus zhaoyuanensis]